MALLQTSLIWAVYAIVVAILAAVASVFIYTYQTPRDRCPSVILTCIVAVTTLLATVLLVPVDVALVSSTINPALGRRQDWATQSEVDRILLCLKIVYYFLYSLDALLCLIVIPFIYFLYEEYDEVASETEQQSFGQRFWAAFKYTVSFLAIVVVLFLVGFFVPVAKDGGGGGLDYFKHLLTENRKLGAPSNYCSFSRYIVYHRMLLLTGSYRRRRTCPYICSWFADNDRPVLICFIYFHGSSAVSYYLNQGRPVSYKPDIESDYSCAAVF